MTSYQTSMPPPARWRQAPASPLGSRSDGDQTSRLLRSHHLAEETVVRRREMANESLGVVYRLRATLLTMKIISALERLHDEHYDGEAFSAVCIQLPNPVSKLCHLPPRAMWLRLTLYRLRGNCLMHHAFAVYFARRRATCYHHIFPRL